MSKLLVLQGVPGSGKSTWAKEFIKGKKDWVRVSRDDLRRMRGDYWIPEQEGLITKIEDLIVEKSLANGYNVIIDATNLNSKSIIRWEKVSEEYESDIEFKFFDCPLEEAIRRDSLREGSERVGEKVIRNFFDKYVRGKLE